MKLIFNDKEINIPIPFANAIKYKNNKSGLSATNVQDAIDELDMTSGAIADVAYVTRWEGASATTDTNWYTYSTVPTKYDKYIAVINVSVQDSNPVANQDHSVSVRVTSGGQKYTRGVGWAFAETAAKSVGYGGSYFKEVDKGTPVEVGLYVSSSQRGVAVNFNVLYIPIV